jgi:hypothetical protein
MKMHEKRSKARDPVERLDEIVAELDRLYAEANDILDHYDILSHPAMNCGQKALN